MYYIYILLSIRNQSLYIGRTTNVVRRLAEHNSGKTFTTKKYLPWILIYIEGYFLQDDAMHREQTLKQFGKVYSQLRRRLAKSILSALKVRG